MKKEFKKISVIVFALLLVILGFLLVNTINAKDIPVVKRDYTVKYAYKARDDGWYDCFKIFLWNNGEYVYDFNGYNLKYDKLDGYYVPVVDGNTGELLDKVTNVGPLLSISEKYRDDISLINDYFHEKQFKNVISIEDLNDLKIKNIDKDYVLSLFNIAINSEEIKNQGKYIDKNVMVRLEQESSNKNLKGKYILTYMLDYGYVSNVYIDFQFDDHGYLSSNLKNDENISLENMLVELSKKLVHSFNENNFDINDFEINTNNSFYEKDLKELIDKMYRELES